MLQETSKTVCVGGRVRTNRFIWRTRISCWGSTEIGRKKERVGWNSLTLDIHFLKKIKDNPRMTFKHFLMLACIKHNSFLTKCSLMSNEGRKKTKAFMEALLCSSCCTSPWCKLSRLNCTKTLGMLGRRGNWVSEKPGDSPKVQSQPKGSQDVTSGYIF